MTLCHHLNGILQGCTYLLACERLCFPNPNFGVNGCAHQPPIVCFWAAVGPEEGEKDIKAANHRKLEQSLPHLYSGSYRHGLVGRGGLDLLLERHLAQVNDVYSSV